MPPSDPTSDAAILEKLRAAEKSLVAAKKACFEVFEEHGDSDLRNSSIWRELEALGRMFADRISFIERLAVPFKSGEAVTVININRGKRRSRVVGIFESDGTILLKSGRLHRISDGRWTDPKEGYKHNICPVDLERIKRFIAASASQGKSL